MNTKFVGSQHCGSAIPVKRIARAMLMLYVIFVSWGSIAAEIGEEEWSYQTLGEVFAAPAVGEDGTVYFGSRDGLVYAVSPSGELRWQYATGDWVDCAPTLSADGETLYVGSWDNKMYALDAGSGTKVWEFETGSLLVASPALDANGNLYFGSADGFFYSLEPDGGLRWSFYVGAEMDSSPAISESGQVHVGAYDGSVYAFSEEGELLWDFATRETEDEGDQRIAGPISVGENGEVYFGGGDGYVYALDKDGEKLWDFEAYEMVDTGVVIGQTGELVFASRSGYVYALDDLGVLIWESFVGDVFYSTPAIDRQGNIYVGSYLGSGVSGLTVLDVEGDVIWEYLLLDYIDSPPVFDYEGRVLFGGYDGALYAIEAEASPAESAWHRFAADRRNSSRVVGYQPDALTEQFAAWLDELGLIGIYADPCFDEDGDGAALALEYLLGGDPQVADHVGLRIGATDYEGAKHLYIEHEWIRDDDEFPGEVEYWAGEGMGWRSLLLMPGVLQVVQSEDTFGNGWYRTLREYLPLEVSSELLFRVRASCD